jgi:hypothetical protein
MFQSLRIKKTIINMDTGKGKGKLGIWPLPGFSLMRINLEENMLNINNNN